MADAIDRCRLCLVTPSDSDVATSTQRLDEALSGGDVASLIITAGPGDGPPARQRLAEAMVPVAQARGVAALVHGDIGIAERTRADGVHVDRGIDDLRAAIAAMHPDRIVGVGGLPSRHDAMLAGELQPDYLFFGRLDGDNGDTIFARSLDLAAWWASVAVIPTMVMGGHALASVDQAADNNIEFVALSRAIWQHPRGPAKAVAEACARLAALRKAVA